MASPVVEKNLPAPETPDDFEKTIPSPPGDGVYIIGVSQI